MMNRRTLLKWLASFLGAMSAAIVAVPGLRYVLAPLQQDGDQHAVSQRAIPLAGLQVGVPADVVLMGTRRDAWMTSPDEPLGRVWLVLQQAAESPEDAKIIALSAVCPHEGCSIGLAESPEQGFQCPCHRARFDAGGGRIADRQLGYHNPSLRDMDALDCRVVQDEPTGQWWVEVTYANFEPGVSQRVRMS